jgi:hypothetical protein
MADDVQGKNRKDNKTKEGWEGVMRREGRNVGESKRERVRERD